MNDIKSKAQGIEPNLQARDISYFTADSKNIYESLVIISKRANQISVDLKRELHSKLEEFATHTDAIEEIHENKEQIEISKFYERLPNPSLIATHEYLEEQVEFRYKDTEGENDDVEDLEDLV